jgi:hypothetical protein
LLNQTFTKYNMNNNGFASIILIQTKINTTWIIMINK